MEKPPHQPVNTRVEFGRQLKRLREWRGLTQEGVVERLSLWAENVGATTLWERDASWLSRLESGAVARVERETVQALAEVLGCRPDESVALLLAAGISPYLPLPGITPEEAWTRYRALAAALPPNDAGGT